MRDKIRTLLTVVLSITMVVGLVGTFTKKGDYEQGEADYSAAEELAAIPEQPAEQPAEEEEEEDILRLEDVDPTAAILAGTDIAALKNFRSEVLGWITIPGTQVNYPLMRHREDNEYYLEHTWKGEKSSVGAIFLDCHNYGDFRDDNTVIYGHNMRNRSMFGELKFYKDEAYWAEHPSIYIVDDECVRRYDIYAAYSASVKSETYRKRFETAEEKEAFLRYGLEKTQIDTGIVPTAEDRIVTLSTCTGSTYAYRWVVQGILVDPEDLLAEQQAEAAPAEE